MRWRLRRREGGGTEPATATDEFIEIDAAELTGVFATPSWLRDVGFTAWLLVGVALFLVRHRLAALDHLRDRRPGDRGCA